MIDLGVLDQVRENIENARVRAGFDSKSLVEIIAVTKTFPANAIISAYNAGIFSIGENKVQEAVEKFPHLPILPKLTRRFIGHLQSNKVRTAINVFDAIDAIDTLKLGRKVSRFGVDRGKPIPVLLQVNTSGDPKKYGFDPIEIDEMLALVEEPGLRIEGLFTLGRFTEDKVVIRKTFRDLRKLKESLNEQISPDRQLFHLSMGMTSDYEIAVEEGATMVRLGTVLFGKRGKES